MVYIKVDSSKKRERAPVIIAPHSWELDSWPEPVWPHNGKRARWVSRAYRKQLIAAGAISRIGKILVFFGAPYTRWMQSQANNVAAFEANNPGIGKGITPRGAGRPRKHPKKATRAAKASEAGASGTASAVQS